MGLRRFFGLASAGHADRGALASEAPHRTVARCSVCGSTSFADAAVLWPELIAEWEISTVEVAYIDRQQGTRCTTCGTSLRGVALAGAFLRHLGSLGPLTVLAGDDRRILDLNGCAGVSEALARLPGYERRDYPQIDMQAMPFSDGAFDIVMHSDTLEHVADPVRALRECLRVTSGKGAVIFTIPLIVGRLTRSRDGLPRSLHGAPNDSRDDFVVRTEFGADFWAYALLAGASSVTVTSAEFPSAQAITLHP
ncbi:MAG: methyltransferase domain-containing protein [Dehalococcoidia bacterium]